MSPRENLIYYDPDPARQAQMDELGVATALDNAEVMHSPVVVLSVKPQVLVPRSWPGSRNSLGPGISSFPSASSLFHCSKSGIDFARDAQELWALFVTRRTLCDVAGNALRTSHPANQVKGSRGRSRSARGKRKSESFNDNRRLCALE